MSFDHILNSLDELTQFVSNFEINQSQPIDISNLYRSEKATELILSNRRAGRVIEKDGTTECVTFSYRYGTSGFRGNADTLNSVMVRVGFLAVLRSLTMNCQAIGVMVTASHNAEEDNGVKIIDPTGEMLDGSWEVVATQIANCPSMELINFLSQLAKERESQISGTRPIVFIGRDTRPHSFHFANLVQRACQACNCDVLVRNVGEVTTPQLHYLVRRANQQGSSESIKPNLYYDEIFAAFRKLLSALKQTRPELPNQVRGKLIVDCASGIGGDALRQVQSGLGDVFEEKVELVNVPRHVDSRKVNDDCGADYVQKEKFHPAGFDVMLDDTIGERCASVDGDCDRLVYFSTDADTKKLVLLDGDKIICLLYAFISPFVENVGVPLTVGIIQTAYANGSSTRYIRHELGKECVFTKTGVKHLHHEATKYDVSIYFEANGHGTVLFSEKCISEMKRLENESEAARILLLISQVSNQAIGDAMADLLLVEASLFYLGIDIVAWSQFYREAPQRLTKLRVEDRTVFETTNAEQTCVKPEGLQAAIDEIVGGYRNARSFVRPSGTEDVVRVYGEADTEEAVEELTVRVMGAVYDLAGGVGARPQ